MIKADIVNNIVSILLNLFSLKIFRSWQELKGITPLTYLLPPVPFISPWRNNRSNLHPTVKSLVISLDRSGRFFNFQGFKEPVSLAPTGI